MEIGLGLQERCEGKERNPDRKPCSSTGKEKDQECLRGGVIAQAKAGMESSNFTGGRSPKKYPAGLQPPREALRKGGLDRSIVTESQREGIGAARSYCMVQKVKQEGKRLP